jgi:TetR/AcrR family transcriptional regulator, transcriptional repressor for nem operon
LSEPSTKERLLDAGWAMLLERGYHGLGVQAVLDATGVPKGSFYHHFRDKEDFALQVVDRYMAAVHAGLDACLGDASLRPLQRVRRFFEMTERAYRQEGYLGCLLGGLGQELAAASDVFRRKIDGCIATIAERLAGCLADARTAGELAKDADPAQLANVLVDCWEGAALRSRLKESPAPLMAMLDFYFERGLGGTRGDGGRRGRRTA